jgi:hypothetical protein
VIGESNRPSDGNIWHSLNLSNLAKEAGVSWGTVYRDTAICVEFHNRSQQIEEIPERVRSYGERLRDLNWALSKPTLISILITSMASVTRSG